MKTEIQVADLSSFQNPSFRQAPGLEEISTVRIRIRAHLRHPQGIQTISGETAHLAAQCTQDGPDPPPGPPPGQRGPARGRAPGRGSRRHRPEGQGEPGPFTPQPNPPPPQGVPTPRPSGPCSASGTSPFSRMPKPSSFSMPAISFSCCARKAAAGSSSPPSDVPFPAGICCGCWAPKSSMSAMGEGGQAAAAPHRAYAGQQRGRGGGAPPAPISDEHRRLRPISDGPWRGLRNASQSVPREQRGGGAGRSAAPVPGRAGRQRRAPLRRAPRAAVGPGSRLLACQSTGAPLGQDTGPSATWRQIRARRIRPEQRFCQTSFVILGFCLTQGSLSHRNTASVRFIGITVGHLVHRPCLSRVIPEHLAQDCVYMVLEYLQ